ncbi:hypothetical protein BDV3_006514 [Batrachochytrium dendrobatidis]
MDTRQVASTHILKPRNSASLSLRAYGIQPNRTSTNQTLSSSRGLLREKSKKSDSNIVSKDALVRLRLLLGGELLIMAVTIIGLVFIPRMIFGVVGMLSLHLVLSTMHIVTLVMRLFSFWVIHLNAYSHLIDLTHLCLATVMCSVGLTVYCFAGSYFYTLNTQCNQDCNNVFGVTSITTCIQNLFSNGTAMCDSNLFGSYQKQLVDYTNGPWILLAYVIIQVADLSIDLFTSR